MGETDPTMGEICRRVRNAGGVPPMTRAQKRRERRYCPSAPLLNMRLPRPRIEIDRGLAWFVIWTVARAERRVEAVLQNAGLATYAPVETVRVTKRGRVVEDER